MIKPDYGVGAHRPVYLWAGPGTIRMNQLKFMGAPVDEAVHYEAHTPIGAQRMAQAGFNWAYLMFNWGFPEEIENQDWESFRAAVPVYQKAGIQTFGYIQTSNCVVDGSQRDQDWYARDPQGRTFYYYTGRWMTCWRAPQWIDHLKKRVRLVVESGSDGVFFDNPWHGASPLHVAGAWLGGAGCYCSRCQAAFKAETGEPIPAVIAPETDEVSRRYLRWRTQHVAATIKELGEYARSLRTDIQVSVNDFDSVMRPSYLIYGIDLRQMAGVQDVLMIEDYGLPRWEPAATSGEGLLVNNALTVRTALALAGDTPVSTDPYDRGIGFDDVYPPRRFLQGMAEAAACNAPMVVKGTEFVQNGRFTLLTAEQYAEHRQHIGALHTWLTDHQHLYRDRSNLAPVGLVYPEDAFWQNWDAVAPLYFAAAQTLTAAGIAWKVVTDPAQARGLSLLISPVSLLAGMQAVAGRTLLLTSLAGWETPSPALLARQPVLRSAAASIMTNLYRAYFDKRWARQLGDRLGLVHMFLQSPYFRLPSVARQQALLAELTDIPGPRLQASAPVLVERWQQGQVEQIHLVNYASQPQSVQLSFPRSIAGRVIAPGRSEGQVSGHKIELNLDVMAILLLEKPVS